MFGKTLASFSAIQIALLALTETPSVMNSSPSNENALEVQP